jgi:FAD/FMN-containing dehydrogenase/Fe-S oxidoreductase
MEHLDRFHEFQKELTRRFADRSDITPLQRGIYATDASNYQQIPIAVAWPRDTAEVQELVALALDHGVPILARGAGTSLAGQAVGPGLVIDMSRHLNRILSIDPEARTAVVQPGVVRDQLNREAARYGLQFAPDPATSNRATIGGMVANNSSGTRSIRYGKTIDHLHGLEVLTGAGELLRLGGREGAGLFSREKKPAPSSAVAGQLRALLAGREALIAERFPKVMRRVGGYPLDYLMPLETVNPALLFCGSEGTLGVITEAQVGLVPLPLAQAVCVLHFDSARRALDAVKKILDFQPSAVELLDRPVLELGRRNAALKELMQFVDGDPGGLLLVEFSGESNEEVLRQAMQLKAAFLDDRYDHPVRIAGEHADYHHPWELRKQGLGIIMGDPGRRKPVAFIEDSCVPVDSLPAYIDDVLAICSEEGTQAIIYAHASVGVIHVRPLLDLRDATDIEAMQRISERVFERVVHYGGAWSGEHGDGYARSYKNEAFFGPEVYALFKEIKRLFDPQGLMNPGKIVDAPPIDQHLRYGQAFSEKTLPDNGLFQFEASGGFAPGVHLCSGVGECLKTRVGVMCPSYRATRDEIHGTRGRANALRLAMSGQLEGGLTGDAVHEALDLCLSCKACKTECPSNVDMARLKSQVNHWRFTEKGLPLRTRFLSLSPTAARRLSGRPAPLVNSLLRTRLVQTLLSKVLGISTKRPLPRFSRTPFPHSVKNTQSYIDQIYKSEQPPPRVVLFADTYTGFHDDHIARKAHRLLIDMGLRVAVFSDGCCQRPALSEGNLTRAKRLGQKTVDRLLAYAGDDPVIVLEPGCASAFRDDLPDLIEDKFVSARLKRQVMLLEEWLGEYSYMDNIKAVKPGLLPGKYAIHGHCHHKAVFGLDGMKKWFARHVQGDLIWLDSGCCGMAGSFGYKAEHYEVSKLIAAQSIETPMNELSDRTILATGFSCRHQISDLTDYTVKHWLEAVEW